MMRKNWMILQMEEARKLYDSWPQWVKDAYEARQSEAYREPTYPNHYDANGYCDNPGRGY